MPKGRDKTLIELRDEALLLPGIISGRKCSGLRFDACCKDPVPPGIFYIGGAYYGDHPKKMRHVERDRLKACPESQKAPPYCRPAFPFYG